MTQTATRCKRGGCTCEEYLISSSKWTTGRCKICNHTELDHGINLIRQHAAIPKHLDLDEIVETDKKQNDISDLKISNNMSATVTNIDGKRCLSPTVIHKRRRAKVKKIKHNNKGFHEKNNIHTRARSTADFTTVATLANRAYTHVHKINNEMVDETKQNDCFENIIIAEASKKLNLKHQRARWFKIDDKKSGTCRYELAYIIGKDKKRKEYVRVRRMNGENYPNKLHLQNQGTKSCPLHAIYHSKDLEWFLYWGFKSFLEYQMICQKKSKELEILSLSATTNDSNQSSSHVHKTNNTSSVGNKLKNKVKKMINKPQTNEQHATQMNNMTSLVLICQEYKEEVYHLKNVIKELEENVTDSSVTDEVTTLKRKIVQAENQIQEMNKNVNELENINNKSTQENNRLHKEIHTLRTENETYKMMEDEKKNNETDICSVKFKDWLQNTVKLKHYLSNFEQHKYNDIRMIKFFSEDVIKNEIGIHKTIHRCLIMEQINEFKRLQSEFNNILDNNKVLKQYKQIFQAHGILTLCDLQKDIQTRQQLGTLLNVIQENKIDKIWNIFYPNEQQPMHQMQKQNNEGQITNYIDM